MNFAKRFTLRSTATAMIGLALGTTGLMASHAANAGDDTIGEQSTQVAVVHLFFHEIAERASTCVDPIHRILRDSEDEKEHQRHDADEGDPADDRVKQPLVKLVGERRGVAIGPAGGYFADAQDQRAPPNSTRCLL